MSTSRWGGIIGACLGAIIGVSLHQSNITLAILSSQTTWVQMSLTLLIAVFVGALGAVIGSAFDASSQQTAQQRVLKSGAISPLRRLAYVLGVAVTGAALGFVVTGLAFAFTAMSGVSLPNLTNWLGDAVIVISGAILGTLAGLLLHFWGFKKIRDSLDARILELHRQAADTIFEQIGDQVLRVVLLAGVTILAGDAMISHREAEAEIQQEAHTLRWATIIGAVGGLVLGAAAIWPVMYTIALTSTYGSSMVFPGATFGAVIGTLASVRSAGLLGKPGKETKTTETSVTTTINEVVGYLTTWGLLVTTGVALILTTFNQSISALQTTFAHGMVGLVLGFIAGWLIERTIRNAGKQRSATRSAGSGAWAGIASAVGVVALLALCCGLSLYAGSLSANSMSSTVTVSSTQGWQDMNYYVTAGDTVTLQYQSGTWTETNGVVAPTDADGLPANPPGYLYCHCGEPLAGVSTQALIGKVGDGAPFLVGDQKTFTATNSGDIFLRMNDRDAALGDNAGALTVEISAVQPTPTPAPPTAAPTATP